MRGRLMLGEGLRIHSLKVYILNGSNTGGRESFWA